MKNLDIISIEDFEIIVFCLPAHTCVICYCTTKLYTFNEAGFPRFSAFVELSLNTIDLKSVFEEMAYLICPMLGHFDIMRLLIIYPPTLITPKLQIEDSEPVVKTSLFGSITLPHTHTHTSPGSLTQG